MFSLFPGAAHGLDQVSLGELLATREVASRNLSVDFDTRVGREKVVWGSIPSASVHYRALLALTRDVVPLEDGNAHAFQEACTCLGALLTSLLTSSWKCTVAGGLLPIGSLTDPGTFADTPM